MKYLIAIEPGDADHAFGVVVPDLPGCFSAGDTLDEAIDNAREAIELWLKAVIDDGSAVPEARPIAPHRAMPEFDGWIWAAVSVDLASLSDKVERVNITLPNEMAGLVKSMVATGAHATESEVFRGGLRALMARERATERWWLEQVGPAHDALKADPSRAVSVEQLRARIAAEHKAATRKAK